MLGKKQAGVAAEIAKINKDQAACHNKATSNAAMKRCEGAALGAADEILNREYKKITKSLTKASSDKYGMEIHQRLVEAQRAWVSFRNANCTLKATEMLFGSGEGLILLSCFTEMTKARILELDAMFENGAR
jgi:uncharacterized protein YecT (DUF1311 family)